MKKTIILYLLLLPMLVKAQWSNYTGNRIVTGSMVGQAIDSNFLYQLSPVYRRNQAWTADTAINSLSIDWTILYDSIGYNNLNRLVPKKYLISLLGACNDSITVTPNNVFSGGAPTKWGIYAGTTSRQLLVVCDTNYLRNEYTLLNGIDSSLLTFYYNGGAIGAYSGYTNADTSLLLNYTYNSSVGPMIYCTVTSLNNSNKTPSIYRIYNVCSSLTTDTITFAEAPGYYTINITNPISAIITVTGLTGSGFTNSTCTTSSGETSSQSGSYQTTVLQSGTKQIPCSPCLTIANSPYYEMGPTVTINGIGYFNGGTATFNHHSYYIKINNTCSPL